MAQKYKENTIGNRIKSARKKIGWTQKQLAEKSGINEVQLRGYENGGRTPKVETLEKIAAALDVPAGQLLFGESTSYAKISDGNSSVYVDMDKMEKDTMALLDSSPVIAKMTKQEIEEVFDICQTIIGQVPPLPEPEIMKQYNKLNDTGKQKALEYTTDLAQMEKYQKDPDIKK